MLMLFFFKQKTAYDMRISDWSSDVCSSDLEVLLSIEQAVVEYRGKPGLFGAGAPKRVIDGVDIAVRSGEIVALVGASGSGKTTLGRAALGLKELAGGMVRFDGVDIAAMDRRQGRDFRRARQIVFQDPFPV